MNTHRPDDARSNDERLPGEDELGALYRKLPRKEPGPALDAAVLRAAAAAVRSGEPAAATLRPARRARWPVALGSAAILVLAAGLGWRMRDMPASTPPVQAGAVTVQETNAPAAAAPAAKPEAAREIQADAQNAQNAPPPPPAPPPAHIAADAVMAKRAAPAESTNLQERAAAVPAAPMAAPVAAAPAVADQAAPTVAEQVPTFAAKSAQRVIEQRRPEPAAMANSNAGAESGVTATRAMAPLAAPAPPPPIDTARDEHDTPTQELDKIRRLLAADRRDEARQRLADFHRDRPDYPLPDDLRTQLLTP